MVMMFDLNFICGIWIWVALTIGSITCQSRPHFNPSIIQDSRLEPKVDGTFGFQYKTEDGISHVAQGDPTGFIQGSYSYKDPTGLKVNFNYFAGARKTQKSRPQPHQSNTPMPQYSSPQYYSGAVPYEQAREYRPRTRPPPAYTRRQSQPIVYEQQYYTRSTPSRFNEVYDTDDYYNRAYNTNNYY